MGPAGTGWQGCWAEEQGRPGGWGQPEVGVLGGWPGRHLPGSGPALHVSGACSEAHPGCGQGGAGPPGGTLGICLFAGPLTHVPATSLTPAGTQSQASPHLVQWPGNTGLWGPQRGRVAWGSISGSTQTLFPLRPLERTLFGPGPLSGHGDSKSVHRALPPKILKGCPGVYM